MINIATKRQQSNNDNTSGQVGQSKCMYALKIAATKFIKISFYVLRLSETNVLFLSQNNFILNKFKKCFRFKRNQFYPC